MFPLQPRRATRVALTLAGAAWILDACNMTPQQYPMNSYVQLEPLAPPLPNGAAVTRTRAPWSRQRLGYSALVYETPSAPEVLATNEGRTEIARVIRDRSQVQYEVRCFPHDPDPEADIEARLTRGFREVIARHGGARRSDLRLQQSGYPGVEMFVDITSEGSTLRVRMFVGHTWSYVAFARYPTSAERLLQPDVEHFLRSLDLDAMDLPQPDGDGALGEAQTLTPAGQDFAVRIPGRARRAVAPLTLGSLTRPRVSFTVGADNTEQWEVATTTFEGRRPDDLAATLQQSLVARGWTVRSVTPSLWQGYSGRRFELERANGARRAELRAYFTRSRLYELLAAGNTAPDAGRAATFFDSLRIL